MIVVERGGGGGNICYLYCYRLTLSLSSNSIGNSIVPYLGTLGIQKAVVIFVA